MLGGLFSWRPSPTFAAAALEITPVHTQTSTSPPRESAGRFRRLSVVRYPSYISRLAFFPRSGVRCLLRRAREHSDTGTARRRAAWLFARSEQRRVPQLRAV